MLKQQQARILLEEEVTKLEPGLALPSVRELMSTLKLSQSTVMHAIAELAAEGIVERRSKSGIYVSKIPLRSDIVAYLSSSPLSRTATHVVRGIQQALSEQQHALYLLSWEEQAADELETFLNKNRIGSLIVQPISSLVDSAVFIDFIYHLSQKGMRIVIVDVPIPGVAASFVGEANTRAFHSMTAALLCKGIRKIVVVGKFGSYVYASRLEGIRRAIGEDKIEIQQIPTDCIDSLETKADEILNAAEDRMIILADASCAMELAYELRIRISAEQLTSYRIAGVLEPGQSWPLAHGTTVWLEKQSEEMGIQAVRVLRQNNTEAHTDFLNMVQHESFASQRKK